MCQATLFRAAAGSFPRGAHMSDKQPPSGAPFDPMGAFREGRDAYLDAWAKAMVEAVNSEQYAKTTGAMLDTYLAASSPFRDTLEKTMVQVLKELSMPSRSDFISLAERVTNIEMRLDDMDAKLDRLIKLNSPASVSPRAGGATKKRRAKK
jgi:hypothetical protein